VITRKLLNIFAVAIKESLLLIIEESAAEATCYWVVRPSVNTDFAWRDISVVSRGIWMKLGNNVYEVSRRCWKLKKVFKVMDQRSRSCMNSREVGCSRYAAGQHSSEWSITETCVSSWNLTRRWKSSAAGGGKPGAAVSDHSSPCEPERNAPSYWPLHAQRGSGAYCIVSWAFTN